jgi:hypothetical protein
MPVMNIIYVCDDLCDLCEYLRLLEKKKKRKNSSPRAESTALGEGGAQPLCGCRSSLRAKATALGEEPLFNESQIFRSRRRALLQRGPNIWLSAKGPSSTRAKYLALGEGVAPTPNGGAGRDGKTDFGESQGRLSAHIRREGRGKLSAKLRRWNFNVRYSPRASSR